MHEPGRIERSVRLLALQPMVGQATQFAVHQRHETIQRLLVPLAPSAKQQRNVRLTRGHDPFAGKFTPKGQAILDRTRRRPWRSS